MGTREGTVGFALAVSLAAAARAAPAELQIFGATTPGGAVTLRVDAAPSQPVVLIAGLNDAPLPVPGLGVLAIDVTHPFAVLPLGATGGLGALELLAGVPAAPALLDAEILLQAAAPQLTSPVALWIHSEPMQFVGAIPGAALATADFTGDGMPDLAKQLNVLSFGGVHVHLGPTLGLALLLADPTPHANSLFGAAIAALPLASSSGVLVGAPGDGPAGADQSGEVWLFTGPTLGTKTQLAPASSQPGTGYGAALAAADFDGDGFIDVAVGRPGAAVGGVPQAGTVVLHRGPALLPAAEIAAPAPLPSALFGASLAAADVDGDGAAELAVGAPNAPLAGFAEAGQVWLFQDPFAGVATELADPSPSEGAAFGFSLVFAPLAGAAAPDLAVGAPGGNGNGAAAAGAVQRVGEVVVFPDAAAMGVFTLNDPTPSFLQHFGRSMAAGDGDGDGHVDLAVSVSLGDLGDQVDAGEIFVFRGPQFSVPIELSAPAPEAFAWFGLGLAAADLAADGKVDWIVGEPFRDMGGAVDVGALWIFPD